MARLLIDSSIWVEAVRPKGDPAARASVQHALSEGSACWNPIIALELWNGARGKDEKAYLRALGANIHSLDIDEPVWTEAHQLAVKASAQGLILPNTDILIFASAQRHKVELLHQDKHFELLESL